MLRSNTKQEILCQKELVTDLKRARSLLRKRSKDMDTGGDVKMYISPLKVELFLEHVKDIILIID